MHFLCVQGTHPDKYLFIACMVGQRALSISPWTPVESVNEGATLACPFPQFTPLLHEGNIPLLSLRVCVGQPWGHVWTALLVALCCLY